jgi:hypothetical protein
MTLSLRGLRPAGPASNAAGDNLINFRRDANGNSVGFSAEPGSSQFGFGANAGADSVAFGYYAAALVESASMGHRAEVGDQAAALGFNAIVHAQSAGLGHRIVVTGNQAAGIGHLGYISSLQGVLAGYKGVVTGARSVGIGGEVSVTHADCVIVGHKATSTTSGQTVLGSADSVISGVWLGRGVTHTGTAVTTGVHTSDGSGTNVAGDHFHIYAGAPTGSADGGQIRFFTAPAGAGGTTLRSHIERARVTTAGNLFWGITSTDFATGDGSMLLGAPDGDETFTFVNDESNAQVLSLAFDGSSNPSIKSTKTGTATTKPLLFYIDSTARMTLGALGGLQMGAPTGGDKGAGTINVATDIYKNNTVYSDPDYVFDDFYTGESSDAEYPGLMSIDQLVTFTREHHHLPRVPDADGLFARADVLLEKLEEAYLHIFALDRRIKVLEET